MSRDWLKKEELKKIRRRRKSLQVGRKRVSTSDVTPPGDIWEFKYDANELPENANPVWEMTATPPEGTVIEIEPSGYLHTKSITGDVGVLKWGIDAQGEFGDEITAEFRLKVVSGDAIEDGGGSFYLLAQTEGYYVDLYIYRDGLEVWLDGEQTTIEMDTTDDYHSYRLVVNGDGLYSVYVDDVLKHQEPAMENSGNTLLIEYAPFAYSSVVSEHSLDYIYWTKGVHVPE